MIEQWHIFISGFTENRKQSTGLQKCWLASQAEVKPNKVFFPVLPWNYDWYTLARFIQINSNQSNALTETNYPISNPPNPPLINIYAYSWGAGHGAIQLARYLQSVGNYDVQNMVLADPVYYSNFFLFRWRAIFCSRFSFTRRFAPKIYIPSNTLNVFWSRQYNNWPRAHSLHSLPAAKTVIYSPHLEKSLIHAEMDESLWFQCRVKEFCNA